MKLKRFEALTLQEALHAVKAELGPEAVIVSSRRVQKGGGLFGLMSQTMVEVTAAVDQPQKVEPARKPPMAVLAALRNASAPVEKSSPHKSEPAPEAHFQDQLKVATALDPMKEQMQEMREDIRRLREENRDPERVLGPLRQELEGLRIVVGEALEHRLRTRVEGLPGGLIEDYQGLVSQGVNSQRAHDLLRSIVETLGTVNVANRDMVKDLIVERMEQALSAPGTGLTKSHEQKILMLVGPTGVGKTTTVAKLAGMARQQHPDSKTVLITLDTYRVAAVEQLRVYAKILKMPLEVAVSPQDLLDSVLRHEQADYILIDTAGRSPRDQGGYDELIALNRGRLRLENHLVLAAPVAEAGLMEVIRRYQSLPIHRIIWTKLDEVATYGTVFNVLAQAGIPASFLSAGQRVPEDLEVATRRRLVELARGEGLAPISPSRTLAGVGGGNQ
ncbi:MAG: flagellar biosynthesis protein FlhF [Nitrospirales bacterium]